MGCDIHTHAEIYERVYDENDEPTLRWVAITAGLFDYPFFYKDKPISLHNLPMTHAPLVERNYRLFAILADVRNGSGTAGCDTGDWIEPIADPRGVPDDASPEWKKYVEDWGADLHSTTYFTVAELLAYNWDRVVFDRGYVPEADYLRLRNTEESPTNWSGGIWGGLIESMTALEYETLTPRALTMLHQDGKKIYVQHQWARVAREYAGELFGAIERLTASAPRPYDAATRTFGEPDLNAVRIMVGFDN